MPTDLPPDYKPRPAIDPGQSVDPNNPGGMLPEPGADSRDPSGRPNYGPGSGLPGSDGDVLDPSPLGPGGGMGVPSPAGTPTF